MGIYVGILATVPALKVVMSVSNAYLKLILQRVALLKAHGKSKKEPPLQDQGLMHAAD